jgi:hypothetical protein
MTLTATTNKVAYAGNGSTTSFAVTFIYWDDTDVRVILTNDTTGVETVWTDGTQYNITGGSGTTGTLTIDTSPTDYTPATGETLTIKSNLPDTQSTSLPLGGSLPSTSIEERFDKNVRLSQQLAEELTRAIQFSETSPATSTFITETAAQRADKLLAFNASGNLTVTQEIGTFTGNWAASTAYVVRDIIKDTSNNNIYLCIVAHTSSGAQPISSNTDVAKWALLVDAAAAATSATAAATSATAAATSATAAATSATASATSATASATSATASATSATASATSATASATSATAAATSYDNFDDRYLGQKSSDPSVDNDGASLLTGALYFNTSNNVMMVYTGSAWVRTTPTSGDQTNINTLSAAAVITDMSILATADIVADMAILGTADVVTDMNVLATSDIVTDMNVLATADVVTDMNVLGTADVVSDMNTLGTADVVTDMNVLATGANVTAMGVLATSANVTAMGLLGNAATVTDLGILGTADVVSDLNVLAQADVVTDLNTLGTADIVTDMNTLGTAANVTAMSVCADNLTGISNFAARYRVDSSDPSSSLDEGDLAYNSTANVLKYYNGSAWVTIVAGSLTDIVQDGSPQLGGNLDTQAYTLSNASLAQGGAFINPNTITGNVTTTTATLKNMFLMGQITVNDTYTWTIAGDGVLQII